MTFRATPCGNIEVDLRADGEMANPTDPASGWRGDAEMNEFTLFGVDWDLPKLWAFFAKRNPVSRSADDAQAVWAFIQTVAEEQTGKSDWEVM
jgi:hypothetical protein